MTNASIRNTFSVLSVFALAVAFMGAFAIIAHAQEDPVTPIPMATNLGYADTYGSNLAMLIPTVQILATPTPMALISDMLIPMALTSGMQTRTAPTSAMLILTVQILATPIPMATIMFGTHMTYTTRTTPTRSIRM